MKRGSSIILRGQFPSLSANSRGSILVLSLWVLSILGIFSISIGYNVRQKISLADRIDRRNTLYGIAQMGVEHAILELEKREEKQAGNDTLNDSWANSEAAFRDVAAGEGSFVVSYERVVDLETGARKTRYGVQDEDSKINLNKADPNILARLFQTASHLEPDLAQEIAYSIVDWRDSDNFLSHPNYGAEDDYYEDLKTPYGAKNLPFEVLQELLLVRGMTPEIFQSVKDYITVYGSGGVNINTAPKEVLLALGLSQNLVEKITAYRMGKDREEGTEDDLAFTQPTTITSELTRVYSLSSSEVAELSNLVSLSFLVTASTHFLIQSTGQIVAKRAALDVTAVVNTKGRVLFWSVGIPRRIQKKV